MRKPIDEAKLTAYALGELSGKERVEVERYLEGSEEARREVDGIRGMAGLLREALAQQTSERLTPEQRAVIEGQPASGRRRWRPMWLGAALAAAASLVVVALLVHRVRPKPEVRTASVSSSTVQPTVELGPPPGDVVAPATPQSQVGPASSGELRQPPTPHATPGPTVTRAASDTNVADTPLTVGALEDTVTVMAEAPLIVTASGVRGYVGDDGRALPVGRSAMELVRVSRFKPDDAARTPEISIRQQSGPFTTEAYDAVKDNPFIAVAQDPLSTFSIDVDTASYANTRRFLTEGELPPPGAVRIEELVNTFTYDYEPPRGEHPFAVHLAVATCPWAQDHALVRIGLKGREIEKVKRPPSNLVFLVDVSGSMDEPNKLPLLKSSLRLLIEQLDERDRVAVVVYAGASGLVLPSTPAGAKQELLAALDSLEAGGTTHGSEGIRLAYETATSAFIDGGVNRVILATDGDFNVGITSQDELTRLIEEKAKSGVFLTVLGFGMGNYKDSTLEKLADHGNGNYGYIDTQREAQRLLVEQMGGTLVTIAKDVKIQVEFNPARVAEYRLIGYENRILAHQDFDDDTKDAGEIGAGHTVTALYEIVPVGAPSVARSARRLKYQEPRQLSKETHDQEVLTVHLRYKKPAGEASVLLEEVLTGTPKSFEEAPADFRFASAVAAFGMILRDSPHRGSASLADVGRWARGALGTDATGQRQEFLDLVGTAERLRAQGTTP
jgi:Ca-activated chloride channel homolog